MQEGQKKFYDYILENTILSKREDAEMLLKKAFEQQQQNSFDVKELNAFTQNLLTVIMPEKYDEVKEILSKFGGQHMNG